MAGVITASETSWTAPFTGMSPRAFGKLVAVLRCEGADAVRKGRPWSLPLEDRVLLVAVHWRTNLTMRQLAPLFGDSKSAADRIIDHLGPMLALQPRKRFAKAPGGDQVRDERAGAGPGAARFGPPDDPGVPGRLSVSEVACMSERVIRRRVQGTVNAPDG
ncbi:hypothetical protein GCM10010329_84810 [Streptomyces spiroverticillatus]|uniref:Transposase Helix-turn-helix domain-containing protein n=1 Tax=Streptomyces finlayi TaxID=67296 RepID=A0A918X959_9ACTN|nr:hypothetical protein GCM10010329_84810 [Streptomyces spiroverticillatus]GHD19434.1 hypothetical protein GCM10010334_83120 [Streptomyces finlayi]